MCITSYKTITEKNYISVLGLYKVEQKYYSHVCRIFVVNVKMAVKTGSSFISI